MKMNYSQSAGYIETHYIEEYFNASEEEWFNRYREDLAVFASGDHIKHTHDAILHSIEEAVWSMFGDKLGVIMVTSNNKQDNYTIQLDSGDVSISPNYVMHKGKPFIIGPYVQHSYDLSFIVTIPTEDGMMSDFPLSFTMEATGEEEGEMGCFYVTSDIYVDGNFMYKGDKLEAIYLVDYVKNKIEEHLTTNKVRPSIGNDVKAFAKLFDF